MNILFYFNTAFNSTFFGGLLDEAISLSKDNGNTVNFVYCDGVHEICMFNQHGSKPLCKFCSKCTSRVLKQYGIKSVSLKDYTQEVNDASYCYQTAEELRAIDYRGVHLGLGIISNYISITRNLSPKIDSNSKKYFDAHLRQCVKQIDATYRLLDDIKPDIVYTFNPRFEEYRAIFDICIKLGINCQVTEAVKCNGQWKKVIYDNHLPHDILKRKERRNYCWDHYNLKIEDKVDLGRSFYIKRRGGQESGDKKIYVANQIEGDAPVFDESKRNIAIMNSSEDEFAAVGGDWDKLKMFKTQYNGILFILENATKDFHFYLRVHPNLSDIKYKFHTLLYDLEKNYDNITVIPAQSNMSTYTIMEKCEKILCFGSTMGVESAFWGVPSILLGPSYYYYDDIAYVPKTRTELLEMLNAKLKPKNNIEIYKLGAYILDSTPLHLPMRNIDCEPLKRKFFNIGYHSSKFIHYLINEQVTGLHIAIFRTMCDLNIFRRYYTPTDEQ